MLIHRPSVGALAAVVALALLTCAVYVPFLSNGLVFDDRFLFSGERFSEYASAPFGVLPRWPALWSIAVVHVLWGAIEAHRILSLLLHFACAWALYGLIRELQRDVVDDGRLPAFVAAAAFTVHPVAVYGAGYLQQRSIVLATLFGLLSISVFLRGLHRGAYAGAALAALLFSVAVLSKEHAMLIPGLTLAWILARRGPSPFGWRYAAVYLACCIPAALFVVWMLKAGGIATVGGRYEAEFDTVTAQISPASWAEVQHSPWVGSVISQAALYFRYLALWLGPRTDAMSLDLRIDPASTWSPLAALGATGGFLAYGALAAWLMARGGRLRLLGFGLLLPWLLFLLEFTVVRFQEPFVLYRSYLWAPGLAIAFAAVIGRLPLRAIVAAFVVITPLLAVQAQDRLRSLESPLAAWEDAVAKLPADPVPGGWRPVYSLAREYLYAGEPDKAAAMVERCLSQYPGLYPCLFARAAIPMQQGDYEGALPHIQRAIAADPSRGVAHNLLGVAFEELGCTSEARVEYQTAYKLGFRPARYRLESLDNPGKGFVAPKPRVRSAACPTRSAAPPPG